MSAYEHMAARVVEAALDHPPVTFAIHGHPLVAAHPPFLVLELAKALELAVEVLPGISAIDTILADLRLDPVVHGVQMYEATDLLLRRRPLQPDVPAIIWQIGPLETALHSDRVSKPERFTRFVGHLRQFYPARHEVVAIYCSRIRFCRRQSCASRWRIWDSMRTRSTRDSRCTCRRRARAPSRITICWRRSTAPSTCGV